ncbi:P-loop containing nucleoside triphosphate hydrolase protein [Linnemannia elongata AG-77]|uniref:p-loop containing nucleoside triphosphate hydrolase protein n=1 Tax=Linnemannia elongata AG-77 TaxID=1314771 RepID=A0A197KI52_9FUNG|nr:P-loop containing nucleoside triphosphate hydrolase protein [Linnemannia elongata AG-77]
MFWAVLLSSFFANQALQVSSDAWLRVWAAAAKDEVEHNASSVFAPSIVSLMLRETIQYTGSLHASRILHRKALDRVLHLPIRYPHCHWCDRLCDPTVPGPRSGHIGAAYGHCHVLHSHLARELKRHESTTNSPAYSHLAETLNGVTVIRAFGDTIDASAASLSFTYSLAFADNVLWFIRTWTYNEINMNCVERAQGYMALPQENWLHKGEIQVQNLVTSGKIEIDGVDISRIGVHGLRSNLTIIPQGPVLFIEHDDTALWAAFKRITSSLTPSLPTPHPPPPTAPSPGQRQLVGLARALLKNSKIIIMDEATSSVNQATDAKIHATIRESCHDATLLTIAHRLKTIIDFDRVIVMDHGSIVQIWIRRKN